MTNPCALSPLPRLQFFNPTTGAPLAGGKLYTYAAGTTTPLAAYTDATGSVALPNPVILDASGSATVWLNGAYKIALQDAVSNVLWTVDNIIATGVPPAFLPMTGGTLQAASGPTVLALNGIGGNAAQLILQQAGLNSVQYRTSAQGSGALCAYDPTGATSLDVITWTYSGVVTLPYQVSVGTNTAQLPVFTINGAAGNYRRMAWQTAGLDRFSLFIDFSTESGSNAGSNMGLFAYSDAGAAIGTVFTINRANQQVTFNQPTFGANFAASDITLKDDIEPITLAEALDMLWAVDAIKWTWKDTHKRGLGWPAQGVKAAREELVMPRGDGKLSLNEPKMAAFLWRIVQAQQQDIEDLKARLDGFIP